MRLPILYVDDELGSRVVFEQSFCQEFDIETAPSGEAALERLSQRSFAVLVSDQRMPGLSGNELLSEVRRRWPETVRMIVTAYSDIELILTALNQGLVSRYLIKPWQQAELRAALRWGIESYVLCRQDSPIGDRLRQTEALTALGTIAAALLHDLATPMSYVALNAHTLGEELEDLAFEQGLESADRILSLRNICADLTQGTRLLSEMISQARQLIQQVPSTEPPRLEAPHEVISFVGNIAHTIARTQRVALVINSPPTLPPLAIWPVELMQVLINSLLNSIQACARQRAPGAGVSMAVREEGEGVCIEIRDCGPGFAPDVIRNLGRPFGPSQSDSGNGLGLAQIQRIAEARGGRVEIRNEAALGGTLILKLPIARP